MKNKRRIGKRIQLAVCLLLIPTLLTGCTRISPFGLMMQWTVNLGDSMAQVMEPEVTITPEPSLEPEENILPEINTPETTVTPEISTETADIPFESYRVNEGEYAQTVMVYMVGSDLESEYGNATLDLKEMMQSYPDLEHNNIVIYAGGASEWQIDGPTADTNSILLLNENKDFDLVEQKDAENMGEADTLSYFINYCFDNYEAEKYGLILWNHGGGPVLGFGVDENYKDILSLDEMEEAFASSVGMQGEKLEWIGFDACLMNSMEVADMLAPYANYMIASQETEPGWGWCYSFLGMLSDEVVSGATMGEYIIDSYMSFGEILFATYPKMYSDLTLSCVDLKQYQKAEEALNLYFAEVDEDLSVLTYPELVRNRETTRDFGGYSSSFDYCMVDAVHLLEKLDPNSVSGAKAIEAIRDMIVYSDTNMLNANGISICYPYQTNKDYAEACVKIQEDMDFANEYTGFLRDFYAIQNGETIASNWDITKSTTSVNTVEASDGQQADTSDITLQLTEEQVENYASGGYYIVCNSVGAGYISEEAYERANDMYTMIHASVDVELDEEGVLHAYHGNRSIYLHDLTEDTYSTTPLILLDMDSTDEEKRYRCNVIVNNWNIAETSDWRMNTAELQIVVNDENPNGIIRQAIPLDGDEESSFNTPSKQLLDLEDYSSLEMVAQCYYYTQDENGNEMPFYKWDPSGTYVGFDQDLTHEYALEARPLDKPENYYCIFFVKDVQGNVSYSNMIPLK